MEYAEPETYSIKLYGCKMPISKYIISDPEIRNGKLTLKGTRITIAEMLSALTEDNVTCDSYADDMNIPRALIKGALLELAFLHD